MIEKYFVDTNVFIYAADQGAGSKQQIAETLLRRLKLDVHGVISTQVLQEFYVVASGKLRMDFVTVENALELMCGLEVVLADVPMIRTAIDCSILNHISYWDALIVTAARKANCTTLWTEDLNHGQIIQGVRIENPFRASPGSGPAAVRERRQVYRVRKKKATA